MLPMTKISTTILKNYKTQEDAEEITAIQQEFADVFNKLREIKLEAPSKSVDFILNFSKAYKTVPLKNGSNAEMLIN